MIQSIDVLLFTIKDEKLKVALVKRDREPYEGVYTLPGGYIHPEEDADCYDSAYRVLRDKAGIAPPYLEQLQVFSGRERDPRGWSLSVAYLALVHFELIDQHANQFVRLLDADSIQELPFDHKQMLDAAILRIRNKSQYSSLPCYLAGSEFTIPQLQRLYEICIGESINKVSFRRKMDEMGLLEEIADKKTTTGAHRPSQLYCLNDTHLRMMSRTIKFFN